jgi:beta-aspartyl-peptidase (threonine type)
MKPVSGPLIAFTAVAVVLWSGLRAPAAPQEASAGAELVRALQATTGMWNRGDLEGFIAPYDEQTTFVTPGGLIGREALRARYASRYFTGGQPDQQLRFEQLTVRALGADHALMTGRFVLAGGGKAEQTGWFTLVWARTPAGWRIIHDHSS